MEPLEAFVERVLACWGAGNCYGGGRPHDEDCPASWRGHLLAALTAREREIREELVKAVDRKALAAAIRSAWLKNRTWSRAADAAIDAIAEVRRNEKEPTT